MSYDVILRGGYLCCPVTGHEGVADIAFENGVIAEIAPEITVSAAEERDVSGLHVLPGIVDCHVHVSGWMGGAAGHRMLALAGVTTALDMAGPIDSVTEFAARTGTGLTLACIDYVRPGHTVDTANPLEDELVAHLARARVSGAVGLKILGGHFPLTPEASSRVIALCGREGAHVAYHAGSLTTPQNLQGMLEACEQADGHPLQMPHVNSYARGADAPAVFEAREACDILERFPNVWSESYLAPINGNSAKCANGVPESVAAQRNLTRGGYEATAGGLRQAILDGWAMIHVLENGVTHLRSGAGALAAWEAAESDIGMSFYANPAESRVNLAIMRRSDGSFGIDALATDGGGLPRNDLCERGLALVHLQALTLAEFVHKTSTEPARMMGLGDRKGHLSIGADADITVIDLAARQPVHSFGGGRAILSAGEVVGSGTTMIVPPEGLARAQSLGLRTIVAPHGSFRPVQRRAVG